MFKISSFQQQIMRQAKEQESVICPPGGRGLGEETINKNCSWGKAQVLDFLEKRIKISYFKCVQKTKENDV